VDAAESQQLFKHADALYQQGQYGQAIQVLEKLNKAFPNEKNILYPAALCCEKLGRKQVALSLCQQLIDLFNDPRAAELQARLNAPATPPPLPTLDALDLGPYGATARAMPYAAQSSGPNWKLILGVGGGVLALLALVFVLPMVFGGGGQSTPTVQNDAAASDPEIVKTVLLALLAFGVSTFVLYAVLSFMRKLPNDEFLSDILDVALWNFIINLVGLIPLVGFIAYLVILSKRYELSCGELFMCVMLQIAVTVGLVFVLAMLVGGGAGLLGLM